MWLQREKVKHIYYKHMIVEHVVHMVEHADLDPMPSQRAGGNARRRLHHTGLTLNSRALNHGNGYLHRKLFSSLRSTTTMTCIFGLGPTVSHHNR